MSIQSIVGKITFESGELRAKAIGAAVGLYVAVKNTNQYIPQEDVNVASAYYNQFANSTLSTISEMNEEVLFDVRLAKSVAENFFKMLSTIRHNKIGQVSNTYTSVLEALFQPEQWLGEDDFAFFQSNGKVIIEIYNQLVEKFGS